MQLNPYPIFGLLLLSITLQAQNTTVLVTFTPGPQSNATTPLASNHTMLPPGNVSRATTGQANENATSTTAGHVGRTTVTPAANVTPTADAVNNATVSPASNTTTLLVNNNITATAGTVASPAKNIVTPLANNSTKLPESKSTVSSSQMSNITTLQVGKTTISSSPNRNATKSTPPLVSSTTSTPARQKNATTRGVSMAKTTGNRSNAISAPSLFLLALLATAILWS